MKVTLQRAEPSDKQTLGKLMVIEQLYLGGDKWREIYKCETLELPWLENKPFISCIPADTYTVVKHISPTFGLCFKVCRVKDRTHILIHALNHYFHTKGCIGVGDSFGDINADGYKDVLDSKKTLARLLEILPDQFEMEVRDV